MLSNSTIVRPEVELQPPVLIDLREQLLKLFAESMKCIDVTNVMTHALTILGGRLQIGKLSYPLEEQRKIVIIAVGKAAIPMCRVATVTLQAVLHEGQEIVGLAVGPGDSEGLPEYIQHVAGGHPFPNLASSEAAEAAIALLEPLGKNDLVLFLISGGASSMMETPYSSKISCDQVEDFYRALVYSGLPITSMNTLRKHFSKVKGGRLAMIAAPATQCTLIVSDVPDKAIDMVGSGLSLPDPSTVADCREILEANSIRERLQPVVLEFFADRELQETPFRTDAAFRKSRHICLLSNETLLQQVQTQARLSGFHAEIDNTCDDWHYEEAASYLLKKLRSLRRVHKRVCLVSGGELSVKLTEPSGMGGRNQHFALYCAMNLKDTDPYISLLSAGSDGVDGNSPAAGAVADSTTVARARQAGMNPALALKNFDSFPLFAALGDAIVTGPTGNNVRDLRILLSC